MEVAGLVLGALPVLINGLAGLAKAAGTFETLRRPSREYRRYGLFLKHQLASYQNTLTELLGGIVVDEDDLKAMIQDSDHALWSSGGYETQLQQRLGSSYETFQETICEVEEKLDLLIEKLNLREKVYGGKAQDESFYKKELGRFKIAFNKDAYTELLGDIRMLNEFLSSTTQSSVRIEDRKRKDKVGNKHAVRIRRLREHARNIHKSVVASKLCWSCACKHNVMLRVRSSHGKTDLFPDSWLLDVNEPQLKTWHLLELRPEESTNPDPIPGVLANLSMNHCAQMKLKKSVKWQLADPNVPGYAVAQIQMKAMSLTQVRIQDLCSTLMSQSSPIQSELGFLEDQSWKCRVHYKKASRHHDVETLSQLLTRNAVKSSAIQAIFSKRERLAAAATLAYSVLFLDGSWLQPVWNSKDIVLLRDVDYVKDRNGTTHSVHELAFSWVVCNTQPWPMTDAEREKKTQKLIRQRKSAVLFALSMALIELSLGKPLETMKTDEENAMDFVSGNIEAANRLLPHVHDKNGFEYKEVVRRCLDCPFDVQNPCMDNDAFLGIYFDQIARPLMADYEQFIGYK